MMTLEEIKLQIEAQPLSNLIEIEKSIQKTKTEALFASQSQFYYYGSQDVMNGLWNEELKLSSPVQVNDPFEFLPCAPKSDESPDWHEIRQLVSETWHFLSLSTYRNNIRMWAQYGAGHQGLMLTLDFNKNPLATLRKEVHALLPVDYSHLERANVWGLAGQRSLPPDEIKKLVTSKGNDWAHEQECRLLIYEKHCYVGAAPETEEHFAQLRIYNNHVAAFLKLPHACVQKVTVGFESPPALVDALCKIRKAKNAHWKIARLRISPSKFEFEEELILEDQELD